MISQQRATFFKKIPRAVDTFSVDKCSKKGLGYFPVSNMLGYAKLLVKEGEFEKIMEKLERLKEMMKASGAHLEGHFRLTSGLHSGNYMQCARLLAVPKYAEFAGAMLAEKLKDLKPDFVTAPAIGGLIIGHEVARALDVPFLFCERNAERVMKMRRFDFPENSSAVVVEDVITTGGSTLEVGKVLEEVGVRWLGTGVIVNRSGGKHVLPHAPHSLWETHFETWQPADCPFCAKGVPVVKPGSR